jgi:hypothetical protein
VLSVHQNVPYGVQLIGSIVVGESDKIGSLVTVGVELAVLSLSVEGLMHVSNVVDQHT